MPSDTRPSTVSRALHPIAASLMVAGMLASGLAFAAPPAEWAPGRLMVMPRAGLPTAELGRLLKPHGGIARRLGRSDLHVVQLPPNISETAVLRLLERHPLLKFAELDYKVFPAVSANDPYAGSQWHLPITRTDAAWTTATGTGVTIAILDSGVLPDHPDLQANLVPGFNSYDGSTSTADVQGHGTAVAGVAGAALANGVGVAGVAGQALIMPIRITDASGTAYYSSIAKGVIHAADNGVRVANCSYGYLFKNSSVQSAGNYLKSKGGLLVVSAGNNGTDEQAAATSAMITVSATDAYDMRTSWSSYGQMVSLAAPGAGIWTTRWDGGYYVANGTSFSSPLVAGVVALMMSSNPALSPAQIESLLFATATDLGAPGKDIHFGHGRVDAQAAVLAAAGSAVADTQAPTVSLTSPTGGSTVAGLVGIDASAADNTGVTRVELRVNGSTIASDSVAPYQFSWDSRQWPNGNVQVSARAYDAAGNAATSALVDVLVANAPVGDTVPPTVAFSSPGDGQTISPTRETIETRASDDGGPSGIRQSLLIGGKSVATATGAKLSYRWNTRKLKPGLYTLTIEARDEAGNLSQTSIQVRR